MSTPGFFDSGERSTPVVTEHRRLQEEIAAGYEAFEAALNRLEAAQASEN